MHSKRFYNNLDNEIVTSDEKLPTYRRIVPRNELLFHNLMLLDWEELKFSFSLNILYSIQSFLSQEFIFQIIYEVQKILDRVISILVLMCHFGGFLFWKNATYQSIRSDQCVCDYDAKAKVMQKVFCAQCVFTNLYVCVLVS